MADPQQEGFDDNDDDEELEEVTKKIASCLVLCCCLQQGICSFAGLISQTIALELFTRKNGAFFKTTSSLR
jgi:hypothetical protein